MIFIITKDNAHNQQDGEFFVAAFNEEPTLTQMIELGIDKDNYDHMIEGGGRLDMQEEWFNMHELENGQKIEERPSYCGCGAELSNTLEDETGVCNDCR